MKIKLNPDQAMVDTIKEGLGLRGILPLHALLQILAGLREEHHAVKKTGCRGQDAMRRLRRM